MNYRLPVPRIALAATLTAALLAGCNKQRPAAPEPAPDGAPNAPAPDAPNPPSRKPDPAAGTTPPGPDGDLAERVLPADQAPADAPLRAPKGATTYRLSNARIGNPGPGPSPKLMVHYELISGEPGGAPSLVLRTPDGNEVTATGTFGPFQGKNKAGDYVVDLGFGGGPRASGPPKNLEVYLVQIDRRWENEGVRMRYKVSNSVFIGETGRPPQFAREWKPDEAARINNPPPEAPRPNLYRDVGEDTEFAEAKSGGVPVRYVDPNRRPLIGLDYLAGDVDDGNKGKEKGIQQLGPVYDLKQPMSTVFQRVAAKPGYAVGAAAVKTKKVVNAIQLTFMKVKPDGSLDPSDSYTKWIGFPDAGEKETKLGGGGRKAIGFHMRAFGHPYAFALVLDQ